MRKNKKYMKQIFKGTVNDVEFDNVDAYNARIKELLEAGEEVNAQTSTKCSRAAEVASFDMYPHRAMGENNEFIDKYVGMTTSKIADKLADLFIPLTEALPELEPDVLEEYLINLEAIGEEFENLKMKNESAIESVRASINNLENERKSLINQAKEIEAKIDAAMKNEQYLTKADRVIRAWDVSYENFYHQVRNYVHTQNDELSVADLKETGAAINRLWELIFGGKD